MRLIKYSLLSLALVNLFHVQAQEDLMSLLEESTTTSTSYEVTSTWKGMRLISGHTTRMLNPGIMDVVISHRFGRINDGVEEFYGLDNSQIRLGLEFGITKWMNFGFGRSSHDKVVDGFFKFKILTQKEDNSMPITLNGFTSLAIKTGDGAFSNPEFDNQFSQRLYYSYQLLIARKFNSRLSLQVMPSLIHRNTVRTVEEPNDVIAIGVGGRYKVTNRMSINAEYYPQLNSVETYTNALSFGVDIETGGHIFQIHVSNSRAMIESGFIAETTGLWSEGDLHIGFNISRSFDLKAGKEKRQKKKLEAAQKKVSQS
ncbi:MAG: hypothetical protein JXR07_13425 [Reichenbachiella sp.]